jgi:hypothetical protein
LYLSLTFWLLMLLVLLLVVVVVVIVCGTSEWLYCTGTDLELYWALLGPT